MESHVKTQAGYQARMQAEIFLLNHPPDCLGRTPLHLAAGSNKLEVVNVLLDAGADPNMKDTDGKTPLHHVVYSCSLLGNGYTKVIQTLIDRGADPQQRNNRGETPTDTARIYGGIDEDNRDRIIILMNKYVLKLNK